MNLNRINEFRNQHFTAFHIILGNKYVDYENALNIIEHDERRIKLCKKFAKNLCITENIQTGSVLLKRSHKLTIPDKRRTQNGFKTVETRN